VQRDQETEEVRAKLEAMSQGGVTVVIVGNERHVCGYVALADRVRPSALKAVETLRALGIESIVMLTGDNTPTAKAIARVSSVDDVRADLLPADKVTAIENLVSKYGSVAMA
jgi:Cd2+/Zn2+-exporting ATPase